MSLRLPGQIPRLPEVVDRWLRRATFAILLVLAWTLLTHRVFNSDIWWHVKTGERLLDGSGIPRVDPYSYTAEGNEWIDLHWGFQVLAGLAFRFGGGVGLNLLLYAGVGVALAITAWNQYDRRYWSVTAGLLLVLLLGANTRFLVRPEIFTFALLSAVLVLLMHQRDPQWGPWLWAVPPLIGVWANVQGLFVLGIVLVGLAAAGEILRQTWPRQLMWDGPPPLDRVQRRRLGAVTVLSVVAGLATPYGWRGLLFPLALFTRVGGGQNIFSEVIAEFQPPMEGYITTPTAVFFLFLLAAGTVLVANFRRLSISDVLWVIAFLFLGMSARRNITVALFVLVPLVAASARQLLHGAERTALWDLVGLRMWAQAGLSILICLIAGWHVPRILSDRYYVDDRRAERFGLGVAENIYPGGAMDFIEARDLPGPLFNSMYIGGYAIYRFAPERYRVSLDSRLEVHTAETVTSYVAAAESRGALRGLLRRYGARTVVITHYSQDVGTLFGSLLTSREWHLVYLDPVGAVFVDTTALLSRNLMPLRLPLRTGLPEPVSAGFEERAPAWARALRTAVDRVHWGPRFPAELFNLGSLYTQLRLPHAAIPLFEAGVARYPLAATGLYNLGVAYQAAGRLEDAQAAYERAVEQRPRHASAWVNIGQLADHRGDVTAARHAYEQAVRADGGNVAAHYNLAATLIQAGEDRRAYGHLRSLVRQEPASARWQILYGRTAWRVGRYVEAARALQGAVTLAPDTVPYWLMFSDFLFALSDNATARPAVARALGVEAQGAVDAQLQLRAQATDALRRAFELNPTAPAVRRRLRALDAPVAP